MAMRSLIFIAMIQYCYNFLITIACQSGWTEFENYCYLPYMFEDRNDWNEAEANCVKLGGHLASVHSDAENSFISIELAGDNKNYYGIA